MKSTRRQISGILQIIIGVMGLAMTLISFLRSSLGYELLTTLVLSAMFLGIGIYYVSTFKKLPIKRIEFTLNIILLILILLTAYIAGLFWPTKYILWAGIPAYILGAPNSKGYKGMPFAK